MRAVVSSLVVFLGLALGTWPLAGRTQADRDFVFTDEEGHLVIRFAGAAELDEAQAYEVLNQEFSRMVHDRLHADIRFADEPRDREWAQAMVPQLMAHVSRAGPEFSDIFAECRAVSCRIILEQPVHWSDPEQHKAVLEAVQASLEAFIAGHRPQFEPGFMITAYYQANETSHIKAFLRRSRQEPHRAPAGG